MKPEQIEKFLGENKAPQMTKFFFKARATMEGIFIKAQDYEELKKKNFWRIVSLKNVEDYRKSKDLNLSRIFNGDEFVRLGLKAD